MLENKNKVLVTLLFILTILCSKAQTFNTDSLKFSSLNKSKLSFILDDTYFIGGINTSGIYYSNNFRQLSYKPGFSMGIEQYFPLKGKVFLSTGFNLTERNFSFQKNEPKIAINNLYIDCPLTAAFELPVMRTLDFRVFLGAVVSKRLQSNISGNYEELLSEKPDVFQYQKNDFHAGDFGWHFGLSAEYKSVIFRCRSYSGFVKLDKKDQGMLSSFNFEVGYFLFRNLKR